MTKALEQAHKVKLIRDLYQHDHAFLSKQGVEHFTKPFGFIGTTYMAKANPQDFKGLSLYDEAGNPVPEWEGQNADVVAREICQHLKVKYNPMFGRGSGLRECCARLLEYLTKKAPSPENA
jgi:hypothetical protein